MKRKRKISAGKAAAVLLLALALLIGTAGCHPAETEPEVVVADALA